MLYNTGDRAIIFLQNRSISHSRSCCDTNNTAIHPFSQKRKDGRWIRRHHHGRRFIQISRGPSVNAITRGYHKRDVSNSVQTLEACWNNRDIYQPPSGSGLQQAPKKFTELYPVSSQGKTFAPIVSPQKEWRDERFCWTRLVCVANHFQWR